MGCTSSTGIVSKRHEAYAPANNRNQRWAVLHAIAGVVIPLRQAKKHMFFAYAVTDESDVLKAEELRNNFNQRRFRVYCPSENDDINTKIANGIENAVVVLVFSSPALQASKVASKLLNYADQRKTPILNIKICEDFQPTDWLGAILAPTKSCSTDFDEIMESLISMGIQTNDLVLDRDERNESRSLEKYLFYGGSKSGNLKASYYYRNKESPMDFEFFGLGHGKIFGQGDDEVGAFTIAGHYNVENGNGDADIHKQYVGRHSVIYRGKISFKGIKCVIEGQWEIRSAHDKFFIHMTLSKPYEPEIENEPSTNASRKQGNKVIISYCPCQYGLAQRIAQRLNARGVPAVCPPLRLHEMIKVTTEDARVVVPLMSYAYEASSTAKYLLTYADEAGIPIVPVKAEYGYSQKGWLGVICAGTLWVKMANDDDLEKNFDKFLAQLHPYVGNRSEEEQNIDALVDGYLASGYYVQWGQRFDMKFDMFALINGYIAGQGDDGIGGFVLNGNYTPLEEKEKFQCWFKKHYIGQHDVQYVGIMTHDESQFYLDGRWFIGTLSDDFHLEIPRKISSGHQNGHIMFSYQWKNQTLVKQIVDMLRKRNIPIWFDIAGDMKGNINTAMANGVEGAAMVVSFITAAYSKSINCQKEFIYAFQLKKTIVPVLLEDRKTIENTWLANMIASLKEINMEDQSEFDSSFGNLLKRIRCALDSKISEDFYQSKILTRFEGGTVEGKHYYDNEAFDMTFEFFSLREGRVSGQGSDTVGAFTMAGKYDNEGNISFIKQYVGKHAVEHHGVLQCDESGGFTIEGKWIVGYIENRFSLKSVNDIKYNTLIEKV